MLSIRKQIGSFPGSLNNNICRYTPIISTHSRAKAWPLWAAGLGYVLEGILNDLGGHLGRFSPVGARLCHQGHVMSHLSPCERVNVWIVDGRSLGLHRQQMSRSTTCLKMFFLSQPGASLTPLKPAIFSGQCACTYLLRLSGDHPDGMVHIYFQLLAAAISEPEEAFWGGGERSPRTHTDSALFSLSKLPVLFWNAAVVSVDCELLNSTNFIEKIPCLIL